MSIVAPPTRTSVRGQPGSAFRSRLRDPMTIGIVVSVALHVGLLGVRVVEPDPARRAAPDSRLDVVLVNARTERRPDRPAVLAQADLEAGGDRDRARPVSPLPASARAEDGTDLELQRRRAQAFVDEQRRLLLAARRTHRRVERDTPSQRVVERDGAAPEDVDRAIARLQAQLDRDLVDGGPRPRRLTYGLDALGVSYARYVDDWAQRVERIGTRQYPDEARGRLYDALLVTVEIDRSGDVVDIVLHNPSRHPVLNRAVRRVVLAGAPYPRFSPEMARDGDTIRIVRVWNFTNDALATRPAGPR